MTNYLYIDDDYGPHISYAVYPRKFRGLWDDRLSNGIIIFENSINKQMYAQLIIESLSLICETGRYSRSHELIFQ
jgi:hypothetical protein